MSRAMLAAKQEALLGWRITKWDGECEVSGWEISGRVNEPQVCTLLERLVSKSLGEREIIEVTEGKTTLLSRIGTGLPIAYGSNPHFTADPF
jgi:hypothetical protein